MKRLMIVALICCMALSMTACQGKTDDTPTDSVSDTSSVSVPEERDEAPEDSRLADETSIQEPDSQPSGETPAQQSDSGNPIVYMTTDISPEGLMAVYEALGASPEGKIAVKIASGEPGSNYLRPELIGDFVQSFDDVALVECNTIYGRFRTGGFASRFPVRFHPERK